MDDLTSKPRTGVPGVVYAVINNKGRHIFEHASGNTDVESHSPISLSTTFWLASCTKLIMSIAVMQLVEQGNLSLDDFEQVEEYLPVCSLVAVYDSPLADQCTGVERTESAHRR